MLNLVKTCIFTFVLKGHLRSKTLVFNINKHTKTSNKDKGNYLIKSFQKRLKHLLPNDMKL